MTPWGRKRYNEHALRHGQLRSERRCRAIAMAFGVVAICVSCHSPATTAPRAGPIQATETQRLRALAEVCARAPELRSRTAVNGATTNEAPLFAVRVKVSPGERDPMKGDGQIGMQGFVRNHKATVLDAKGTIVWEDGSGECLDNYFDLPQVAGEYCVVFEPMEARQFSTFRVDFEAGLHYRATEGAYEHIGDLCN